MSGEKKSCRFFILSLVATDRPGIVDDVSKFLFERGCSVEDSRMAVLGGEFTMALLAFGPSKSVQRVQSELGTLKSESDLMALFRPTRAPKDSTPANTLPFRICVTSIDHPGILFKISHLLHEKGINIQSADTEIHSAPFGGSPLFRLEMLVNVSATQPVSELRAMLADLADRENMDVEIHAATS